MCTIIHFMHNSFRIDFISTFVIKKSVESRIVVGGST